MTIEQRIEKLERQNRHLKWAIGGLVGLGFAGVLMGAAAVEKEQIAGLIRARGLEIVTADGKPCIILSATTTNTGTITTMNPAGSKVVTIGVTTAGEGTVTTHNKKGKELVKLGATTSGEGVISTHDSNGRRLLEMGVTVKNQPKIFSYKVDDSPHATWP
jgi:hypothetical protein